MATFALPVPPLRTTVLVGSPGMEPSGGGGGGCRLRLCETSEEQLAGLAEVDPADAEHGFDGGTVVDLLWSPEEFVCRFVCG